MNTALMQQVQNLLKEDQHTSKGSPQEFTTALLKTVSNSNQELVLGVTLPAELSQVVFTCYKEDKAK